MRARPNRFYSIMLVALFVLFGSQTAWAAAPTISPAPDTLLSPTEDEVGYSAIFTASDTDGDLESFDVINKPSFLVLQKNTQSEIELLTTIDTRPLAEHVGQKFTFTMSATDKAGAITNQEYSITVQEFNDPPVIQETIVSDEATQGEIYNFEFTVTDEESHPLSWNPDAVDTQLPEWLDVVKGDEYGTFAITSTTAVTNEIALGDSPVQIRIQIDDNPDDPDLDVKSDTLEYLLNLVNINDDPEIDDADKITSDEAIEGQDYEHKFTVTDDDGDALTVVRPITKKPEWITVAASTDSADPPNTWVISGVPSNEDALSTDPHEIDILIKDEHDATDRLQYTIAVQNLNDTPEQTTGFNAPEFATQGEDFTHSFNVEDIDLDEVVWNQANSEYPSSWMDVEVDFLEQENVYQFTLSGQPSNADVLPPDGAGGAQKTETVIIAFNDNATISDPALEEPSENTFQFDITYVNVNDAPTIPATATFPDSIRQDETYEYSFTVTDIDGNDLRVVDSGTQLPAWNEPMTIDPNTGGPSGTTFTISGTPNFEDANQSDPYPVVIKIGDGVQGDEKFFSHEFTISVINENDPPEVILEPVQDPVLDTLATQNTLYSKPIGFADKDDDTINWVEGDSIFPAGMEIQATGSKDFEIRWIPTNDQVTHIESADGTLEQVETPYDVSLKFCDNFEGDSKCTTVPITGLRVQNVNDAPTIRGSIPALVAGEYTQESPFTFTPEVADADELFGDVNFQYTITGQNAISDWSVFSLSNGQLKLFPGASEAENSPYNISISVSDGEDKTPLPLEVIVLPEGTVIESGDFNLDGSTDLSDAILLLKVLVGIDLPQDQTFKVQTETDPNTDDQAGLQDVIFILDHVATP